MAQIGGTEIDVRKDSAGAPEHLFRTIDPDDLGIRKPLDQKLRGIAWPAAEIIDEARLINRHAGEEVVRRTASLVTITQIEQGIPGRHNSGVLTR